MLHFCLRHYLSFHARNVQRSMMDPYTAQKATFHSLQRELRGGALATKSGFDRCQNLEDFRHLPATDGDQLKPLLDQVFHGGVGESHLFGRSKISGFARTSGTFGEPKNIPMNQAYMASLDRSLMRMVACQLFTTGNWNQLLAGRQIMLGSRPLVGKSPTALPISDISGLLPTRTWKTMRRFYLPKYEDLWIENWSHKMEMTLVQANGQDVHTLTGIPALIADFARRACEKFQLRHLNQIWPNICRWSGKQNSSASGSVPAIRSTLQKLILPPKALWHFPITPAKRDWP